MLEAADLECTRGDRVLFSDLSFSLHPGEVLHVNGPNGSGKTTLLRALCGLMTPTGGEVRWRGEKIRTLGEEYLKELSYLGHLNGIKDDLTALENLIVAARLAGRHLSMETARRVLERAGLEPCEDLPVKLLSQGQKRRVALTRLVAAGTVLWVLDEPYSALDFGAVRGLQDIIRQHLGGGGMAVITTHQEVVFDGVPVRHIHLAA